MDFPSVRSLENRLGSVEHTANAVVTQALVPELRSVAEALNATRAAIDLQLILELDVVVNRVDTLEQQYANLLAQLNASQHKSRRRSRNQRLALKGV